MNPTVLIHLFLPSGNTFTFRDAQVVSDNETTLVIDYVAVSDGQTKRAFIQKKQIVGHAIAG